MGGEVVKELYKILEVIESASAAEIKKAHRRLAKEHHPDKGGDPEKFDKIQQAYEVLSDPERRAKYDETGEFEDEKDRSKQEFVSFVDQVIIPEIVKANALSFDLIGIASLSLEKSRNDAMNQKVAATSHRDQLQRSLKRIKRKDDGVDLITQMITQKVDALNGLLDQIDKALASLDRIQEELDKYEYDYEGDEDGRDIVKRTSDRGLKWLLSNA